MGFYSEKILPVMIDRGMRNKAMRQYRPPIPAKASGRVLEVGFGSGLNLPYYDDTVTEFFALEPSAGLRERAAETVADAKFAVEMIDAGAEDIPLETDSVDSVVSTWTLCSIPDIENALLEMRRVLRPNGRLIFIEHGLAPDDKVVRWQKRLRPIFLGLAACNPDRPIDKLIARAGFDFDELEATYFDGPKFISYHFTGTAIPKN